MNQQTNRQTRRYFLGLSLHGSSILERRMVLILVTAQKMKFAIKDFFSKYDQIRRELRIWSYLMQKSLMENFIFCAVRTLYLKIGLLFNPFQSNVTSLYPLKMYHRCSKVFRGVQKCDNGLKWVNQIPLQSKQEFPLCVFAKYFSHCRLFQRRDISSCFGRYLLRRRSFKTCVSELKLHSDA